MKSKIGGERSVRKEIQNQGYSAAKDDTVLLVKVCNLDSKDWSALVINGWRIGITITIRRYNWVGATLRKKNSTNIVWQPSSTTTGKRTSTWKKQYKKSYNRFI